MASFLGHARQWEIFGRKLRRLQSEYGFNILHSTDLRHFAGEFHGWSPDKGRRLVHEIADLVKDNLTEAISATLPRDIYMSEYRAPPIPKGMNLDSQLGLCFRLCLSYMVDSLLKTGHKHRLHIVIERGHPNTRNADEIFNEIKKMHQARGIDLLGDITIASKEESPPLMVADFQAHMLSISASLNRKGEPGYFELTAAKAGGPQAASIVPKGEARISHFEFTPGSLRQVKIDFEQDRQKRVR